MRVAAALHTVRFRQARMLASRAQSCQACHQREMINGLGRHTCQIVGVHVKDAQVP